jgi:CDP-L-myo-inositol myo-inositolphosphotransferase
LDQAALRAIEDQGQKGEKMTTKKVYKGKSSDGFISRYINRKLSKNLFTPLILRIYKRATPNQVSVLGFIISVFGGAAFFLFYPVVGGIIVQLSSVLDGCDGEIARHKKMASETGNFFDAILDRYGDLFILLGVFYYTLIYVADETIFGIHFGLPVVAVLSVLAIFGMLMSEYAIQKSIAGLRYELKNHWVARGRRDLRLFVVFIGGILTYFSPVFAFLALVFVAIETNLRSIGRFILTLRAFQRGDK